MLLNKLIKKTLTQALREDIGKGDITTLFTVAPNLKVRAAIIAKENGILCGVDIIKGAFPKDVRFKALKRDGSTIKKNQKIIILEGNARKIITHERVALNFLSRLSGISTLTRKFVEKTKRTNAKIMDTRKTTPTLRALEKYAVKVGGGLNHRMKLDEAILIKDNHLRAAKFIHKGKLNKAKLKNCIGRIRKKTSLKIEIEVENLKEFKAVLNLKPTIIMLDNFNLSSLKKAVRLRNHCCPKVKLEASGGINLNNVKRFAKAGVDLISIGAITHSAPTIDFSLEIING